MPINKKTVKIPDTSNIKGNVITTINLEREFTPFNPIFRHGWIFTIKHIEYLVKAYLFANHT